jgi:hypothetical protein
MGQESGPGVERAGILHRVIREAFLEKVTCFQQC